MDAVELVGVGVELVGVEVDVLGVAVELVEAAVLKAGVGDSEFMDIDAKLGRGGLFTWCDPFLRP